MLATRYYRYFDKSHKADYYHDPITNTITWNFPVDSEVFDGFTNEKLAQPTIPNLQPRKFTPIASLGPRSAPLSKIARRGSSLLSIQLCQKRENTIRNRRSTLSLLIRQPSSDIFDPQVIKSTDISIYLPEKFLNDRAPVDLAAFVSGQTNAKKKHIKKAAAYLSFEATSNNIPILKATEQANMGKFAVWSFTFINEYCTNPNTIVLNLIDRIGKEKEKQVVVDEIYIQLIKQSRNNSNNDILFRVWDMILLISTLYSASPVYSPFIVSHLAQGVSNGIKSISNTALLAYLRFVSKHSVSNYKGGYVKAIISSETRGFSPFSSCLFEQMWHQRNTYPKCPIPVMLPVIVHYILKNGGRSTQNIFKQSGNQPQIDEMIEKIEDGPIILKDSSASNLASLLKRWISEQGLPLITNRLYSIFESDPTKAAETANKLPIFHKMTVMYIIGFLQEMVKCEDKTNVGQLLIAGIFGSLLFPPIEEYQYQYVACTKIGKVAINELINTLNTKEIYPLPEGILPPEMFP